MTPFDALGYDSRMMSYDEVVRYLKWRARQMREDAHKAALLHGEASDLFSKALENGAEALEASARAVETRSKETVP